VGASWVLEVTCGIGFYKTTKSSVPSIFYARTNNALSVKADENGFSHLVAWYNSTSGEEANQKVCAAKGVRGMEKKRCIGAWTKENPSGKCNGERLHSLKYNSRKKYYCLDCLLIVSRRIASRDTRVGFGV
jgi:hypothetical protein